MKNLFDTEITLDEIEDFVFANFSDGNSKQVCMDMSFIEAIALTNFTCGVNVF